MSSILGKNSNSPSKRLDPNKPFDYAQHSKTDTPPVVAAPSPGDVKKELEQDLGKDFSRKKLKCNGKMIAGIVIGVLVGIVVLAVVLGAVVASHGAVGPALGLLASKLSLGSALAAHGIGSGLGLHLSASGLGWIAKVLSASAVALVFLGGGKIGGELWRRGEAEQMDAFFTSSQKITEIEKKVMGNKPLSEEQIQKHLNSKQATILSSQAGRDFVEAKRRAGLHYTKPTDMLSVKGFGHFWTNVPTTSLQSISDREQYDLFAKNVDIEKGLKELSAGEGNHPDEALRDLNKLRATQVEQLVWRTDAMGVAYAQAPEIQIYDRNIAKLETLKGILEKRIKIGEGQKQAGFIFQDSNKDQMSKNIEYLQDIENRIEFEKAKKALLVEERLDKFALSNFKSQDPKKAKVESLLTIERDIMKLAVPSNEEQRGQILEAVSILLTQNPKATITDVNELVNNLCEGLLAYKSTSAKALAKKDLWKTRKWVVDHAIEFTQATLDGSNRPLVNGLINIPLSDVKAPMTRESGSFLCLRALDVAISAIHMMPVPGSSGLAAGVTLGAVAIEKGAAKRGFDQVKKVANNFFASTKGSPAQPVQGGFSQPTGG